MIAITLEEKDATMLLAMMTVLRAAGYIREPEWKDCTVRVKRELECALLLCDCHRPRDTEPPGHSQAEITAPPGGERAGQWR